MIHKTCHLYLVLLTFCTLTTWAAETPKYPVADIPAELLDNAEAVVRKNSTVYQLNSPSSASLHKVLAITFLKESAVKGAIVNLPYDRFSKINIVSVIVYDKDGKKVKKVKNEDILDFSAISEGSIYQDSRRKYIDPEYQNLPFTVEYTFEYSFSSSYRIPGLNAFMGYNTSIQFGDLKVICNSENDIRYKEKNQIKPVEKTKTDDKVVFYWQINNFAAPKSEKYSVSPNDIYPQVEVVPLKFERDGYEGSFETWKSYGQYINSLNEGRDVLPPERVAEIQQLVANCKTDKEKIEKIYGFAQKKNRYISVQVGIGGHQPFPAETVDRLSYGDCKALSNYNKALLAAAGIKAFYTLIEADYIPTQIDVDFPCDPFNHVVLCVPLETDTVWLECTNPHIACGFFGYNTDNRYALMIKEDGGHLVKTNYHTVDDNVITTTGEVYLTNTGFAEARYSSKLQGIFYTMELGNLLLDDKSRRDSVIKDCELSSFNLIDYQIVDNHQSFDPSMTLDLHVGMDQCASLMGDKFILVLNQYSPQRYIPPFARKRVSDLYIVQNHCEIDTIVYSLPDGYKVEALPAPIELSAEFGSYQSLSELKDGKIIYTRKMIILEGRRPPEKYNEFRSFLEKIAAADKSKCILVKGT